MRGYYFRFDDGYIQVVWSPTLKEAKEDLIIKLLDAPGCNYSHFIRLYNEQRYKYIGHVDVEAGPSEYRQPTEYVRAKKKRKKGGKRKGR